MITMIFEEQNVFAVVFFVSIVCSRVHGYSREELQKIYPGFGDDFVLFPGEDDSPVIGYLKLDNNSRLFGIGENNMDRDVKFEFFSRDYPNGIPIKSKADLGKYVNVSKPTKCVTHGWMSGGNKDSAVLIRNGFLHRYDANIFVMDWSSISGNPFYPFPMLATPEVGRHYGTYLNYLIDEVGAKPEDIHLVGHSLGAHVSGFAGREVRNGKIGRITGLDPALPGFDTGLVRSGTLNRNDANFVDIIHTCAGFLGYKLPLGHADFYPNGGGPPQPGCSILEFVEACSHGRSWKIFASSLVNDQPYVATKCTTLEDVEKKRPCFGNRTPIGDLTPPDARGIFYSQVLQNDLMYYNVDDKNKI